MIWNHINVIDISWWDIHWGSITHPQSSLTPCTLSLALSFSPPLLSHSLSIDDNSRSFFRQLKICELKSEATTISAIERSHPQPSIALFPVKILISIRKSPAVGKQSPRIFRHTSVRVRNKFPVHQKYQAQKYQARAFSCQFSGQCLFAHSRDHTLSLKTSYLSSPAAITPTMAA